MNCSYEPCICRPGFGLNRDCSAVHDGYVDPPKPEPRVVMQWRNLRIVDPGPQHHAIVEHLGRDALGNESWSRPGDSYGRGLVSDLANAIRDNAKEPAESEIFRVEVALEEHRQTVLRHLDRAEKAEETASSMHKLVLDLLNDLGGPNSPDLRRRAKDLGVKI